MSMLGTQLIMMVLMYLGTFISYYLPIRMFSKAVNNRVTNDLTNQLKLAGLDFIEEERQRKIYSNCNCVALGVFIGMCFMNVSLPASLPASLAKTCHFFNLIRNNKKTFLTFFFITFRCQWSMMSSISSLRRRI